MGSTLYMVIEHFKNGDAVPVYRRFRERGRMAPAGLTYVSSWVSEGLGRCYQVMETEDRALLEQWMANWSDIVDFEVETVISSKEAADKIAPGAPKLMFARAATYIQAKRNIETAQRLLQKYLTARLTPDDPPREEARKLLEQVSGG